MSYPKQVADLLLFFFGECWLNSSIEIQYIAVIKDENPKIKKTLDCYTFEVGIYRNNTFNQRITNKIPLECIFSKKNLSRINKMSKTKKFKQEEQIIPIIKNVGIMKPQNIGNHIIRPMVGGCKIQSRFNENSSGTLGAFLKLKNCDNKVFMISNYHTISTEKLVFKDLIYQPQNTLFDYKNVVAHLMFGDYNDQVDVAFAEVLSKDIELGELIEEDLIKTKGFTYSAKTIELKETYLNSIEKATDNMTVYIYGLTTGKSVSKKIISTNTIVKVENAYDSNKIKIFKNQILTETLSKEGDSGSVLINSQNKNVVGLLHAGDEKNRSISCNITSVFDRKYLVDGELIDIKFEEFLT